MSDIVGRIWESLGGLSGSRPAAKFNNDEVALIKAVDGLLEQCDRLRAQVAEQEARAAKAEQALAGLRFMADRVFNALTAWKRDAADWDDDISREIDVMVCEALAGYQPDDAKLLASAVDARIAEQEATIRRLQDRLTKDAETFGERVRAAVEAEREACAKVADECPDSHWGPMIATAIRNRTEGGERVKTYQTLAGEHPGWVCSHCGTNNAPWTTNCMRWDCIGSKPASSPTPPNTHSPCANGGESKPGDAR